MLISCLAHQNYSHDNHFLNWCPISILLRVDWSWLTVVDNWATIIVNSATGPKIFSIGDDSTSMCFLERSALHEHVSENRSEIWLQMALPSQKETWPLIVVKSALTDDVDCALAMLFVVVNDNISSLMCVVVAVSSFWSGLLVDQVELGDEQLLWELSDARYSLLLPSSTFFHSTGEGEWGLRGCDRWDSVGIEFRRMEFRVGLEAKGGFGFSSSAKVLLSKGRWWFQLTMIGWGLQMPGFYPSGWWQWKGLMIDGWMDRPRSAIRGDMDLRSKTNWCRP